MYLQSSGVKERRGLYIRWDLVDDLNLIYQICPVVCNYFGVEPRNYSDQMVTRTNEVVTTDVSKRVTAQFT